MKKIILVIFAIVLWWPNLALALGIEANPTSLKLITNSKGEAESTVTIANPSTEPGLFALSIDDNKEWYKIEPAEVRLEAGERRTVKINVRADKVGQHSTWLSVVGYPLDTRAFKAGSGVKIPVSLTVNEIKSLTGAYILGGAALVCVVLGLYLLYQAYKNPRK